MTAVVASQLGQPRRSSGRRTGWAMITTTAATAAGREDVAGEPDAGEDDDRGGERDEHPGAVGEAGAPCRVGCGRRPASVIRSSRCPCRSRTTPITSSSTAMTVALFCTSQPRSDSSGAAMRFDATR